jgi:hypothetical protein
VAWDDDPHQRLEMKKGVTVMVTPFGFVCSGLIIPDTILGGTVTTIIRGVQ